MDAIQKTLIKAGRKDLAQKYYLIISSEFHNKEKKYFYINNNRFYYQIAPMFYANDSKAYHIHIDDKSYKALSRDVGKFKNLKVMVSSLMGMNTLSIDIKTPEDKIKMLLDLYKVKPKN